MKIRLEKTIYEGTPIELVGKLRKLDFGETKTTVDWKTKVSARIKELFDLLVDPTQSARDYLYRLSRIELIEIIEE